MSRVAHSADSHGHGHAAAAVPAGEVRLPRDKFLRLPDDAAASLPLSFAPALQPVEFLSDPAASSTDRCKRRWNDLQCVPSPQSLRGRARRGSASFTSSFWCAFVAALPSSPSLPPSLPLRRLLRLDALSPGTTVGPTARFASEETVYRQLRERAYTRRVVARLARAGRALPRRGRPPPPPRAAPPPPPPPPNPPPAPAYLPQATCSLSDASRPSLAPSPSTRVSLTRAASSDEQRRSLFDRRHLPLPPFPRAQTCTRQASERSGDWRGAHAGRRALLK